MGREGGIARWEAAARQGGGRRAVPASPAGFPVTLEGITSRLETCLKNYALLNFSSSSLSPLGKFKRIFVNRQVLDKETKNLNDKPGTIC